jgi:small subunit ribosomal protein S17
MKSSEKVEEKKASTRLMRGIAVSNKMEKTVVMKVTRTFSHPLFKKTVRSSKLYKVHDEKEVVSAGDVIEARECAPFSKTKHMVLHQVISSGKRE